MDNEERDIQTNIDYWLDKCEGYSRAEAILSGTKNAHYLEYRELREGAEKILSCWLNRKAEIYRYEKEKAGATTNTQEKGRKSLRIADFRGDEGDGQQSEERGKEQDGTDKGIY